MDAGERRAEEGAGSTEEEEPVDVVDSASSSGSCESSSAVLRRDLEREAGARVLVLSAAAMEAWRESEDDERASFPAAQHRKERGRGVSAAGSGGARGGRRWALTLLRLLLLPALPVL